MNDNNIRGNGLRLKNLLKECGATSFRLDATRRVVMFGGRTREWSLVCNIANDWLHIYTCVCEIPQAGGLRSDLLDAAMQANEPMSLSKFTKGVTGLFLELQYRDEHVDAAVLQSLLGLMLTNAEEYYPRLFRIVSGDAALSALSALSGSTVSTEAL